MPRDARFWRNVVIVGAVHVMVAVTVVGWSRTVRKLDQPNVVWLNDGLGKEAPKRPVARSTVNSEKTPPLEAHRAVPSDPTNESTPIPTQAKSEIQLPIATPSPTAVKTPVPKPNPTPTPKVAPKKTATPTAKTTVKKPVTAKPPPAQSPKIQARPTQEEKSNTTEKTDPVVASSPTGEKSGRSRSGSEGRASEFSWYGGMLHDRFYREWVQPTTSVAAGAKMSALVRVRIESDGRISKFKLVRPSGNVVVDESVAEVAKRVKQVDPLPNGLTNKSFYEVNINFELNPTQ